MFPGGVPSPAKRSSTRAGLEGIVPSGSVEVSKNVALKLVGKYDNFSCATNNGKVINF